MFDIGITIPNLSNDDSVDIYECLIFFVEVFGQWAELFDDNRYKPKLNEKYEKVKLMVSTAFRILKSQMQLFGEAKIPIKMVAYLKQLSNHLCCIFFLLFFLVCKNKHVTYFEIKK